MTQWQQQFAQQMETLCAQSGTWFERFAEDVLEPALESVSGFLDRWHFDVSAPPCDGQRRACRFRLTENAYLLVWFKLEGFDALECNYECSLPGLGRVGGEPTTGSLREVNTAWVESCFQGALSSFVARFVELGKRRPAAEPAVV